MAQTLAQMAYKLEECFLIYSIGQRHLGTAERALNHTIYTTEKLIDLTFDLINGIKQEELLEGEFKPETDFGYILEIFVKAFKLASTSNNEKVKNEAEIILLKVLKVIVEIVNDTADGYSVNVYAMLNKLEGLKNRLNELENQN